MTLADLQLCTEHTVSATSPPLSPGSVHRAHGLCHQPLCPLALCAGHSLCCKPISVLWLCAQGTVSAASPPLSSGSAGLRRVMVRAHRQAWCWQDEWYGLSMENIRELEREVQLMLSRKMAQFAEDGGALELCKESAVQEQASGAPCEPSSSNGESRGRGLKKQWSTSSKSSRSSKRGGELGFLPFDARPTFPVSRVDMSLLCPCSSGSLLRTQRS